MIDRKGNSGNTSRRLAGGMVGVLVMFLLPAGLPGGDWPTYRHDIARSGVTTDEVKPPLAERWVFQPRHRPAPAWGDPNPRPVGGWYGLTEQRRVHFDDAFHVVTCGDAIYFGSSADGKVYALDAATGKLRWSVPTGGPVRLAPTVWRDKLYVGSDDGFVYCLRASDGSPQWRFQAAPKRQKLLGSGKMISLWPVRTGVLVDDGIAYFGAGIFPAEGVFLYAVDAEDGKLVWCNDSEGAPPQSRISPQGYLLASETRLFAPLGRVPPAAFDRKDGRLVYGAYIEHIIGGSYAVLADDQVYTGTEQLIGFDQQTYRSRTAWFWGHQLIVSPKVFYVATGRELFAVDRAAYAAASLRRKELLDRRRDLKRRLDAARRGPEEPFQRLQKEMDALDAELRKTDAEIKAGEKWRVLCDCSEILILAGDVLFAGGDGKVVAHDAGSGRLLWTGKIEGKARGLAAADGRLLVSSDTGAIYCFGPPGKPSLGTIAQDVNTSPFPEDELSSVYKVAAEHIVDSTGIRRGYCLVLGCGTGRLAFELAQRTELTICAVEPDPRKAEAARRALDAAGFYGARVLVECAPLAQVPFSDYFANLVVSEEALVSGRMPAGAREAFRMLKPLGGTICIGQPAEAQGKVPPLDPAAMRQWAEEAGIDAARIGDDRGVWLTYRRGALPGAGSWTHQYANPGNTACSDDQRVRCPLGVLWFGSPGPGKMAERHRRAAAPLAIGGRLFVLGEGAANRVGVGENSVMAFDAYNGVKLWERTIRGALRVSVTHDAGNSAANADSFFVAVGDTCIRLDAATGATRFTYKLPPAADGQARRWGYVAVVGDVLYGSRTTGGRTADCVFAMDLADGRIRWKHEAKGIAQGAIAIGDGRLFFATSEVSAPEREEALAEAFEALKRLQKTDPAAADKQLKAATVYRVVALDTATGRTVWEKPVEITGAAGGAYWCSLGAMYSRDVLVLFGVFLDGHYWKQFFQGQFESRRVVALAGKDGRVLWKKRIGYRVRPLIVGDTFHAEPWAFDLHTGEQKMRVHPVTGRKEIWQFARPGHHCGCPAAAPHTMLFRSYNVGWYDLDGDYGTMHFGAQRPGCWINFIPANGLLMVPEGSSGCMCPFPNTCTVVFKTKEENRQWAWFSQPGAMTPVKRLALNFGAPGDRKDSSGAMWFGYPRPGGSLVLQFKVGMALQPGWSYFIHDPARLPIEGTDTPWVFQSGVRGLRECTIPVAGPADGRARYTVRLAFAELDHQEPGRRVFDIKIQGKIMAKGFDIYKEAGGRNKAVIKEFPGIEADRELVIALVPATRNPSPDALPLVQGIEIVREKVLTVGMAVPSFLLENGKPKQAGELVIVNNKDEDFAGTLRIDAPDRFTVSPAQTRIDLAAGGRTTVALEAAVAEKGPIGKFRVGVELVRADGTIECQREAQIEYLGDRRRAVVQAIEDAHVARAAPTTNYGTAGALNVDGGDRAMGDRHHSVAYLKFRIAVDGQPISAVLRLYNAGNPTGDSGQIRLVTGPWSEKEVTYNGRPQLGAVVGKIGRVAEHQVLEIPLKLALKSTQELSLAIDPTSCDGVNYIAREGGKPAELIVDYAQ